MVVKINNKEAIVEEGITAADLIRQRKMRKAAVWVNGKQLLLAEYENHRISEGDEIRILRIMAGG